MADGHHVEKSKIAIYQQRLARLSWHLAQCQKLAMCVRRTVKNLNFSTCKIGAGRTSQALSTQFAGEYDKAFRNGLQYRHSDFKKFTCDYLATLCANLMKFGPVVRYSRR